MCTDVGVRPDTEMSRCKGEDCESKQELLDGGRKTGSLAARRGDRHPVPRHSLGPRNPAEIQVTRRRARQLQSVTVASSNAAGSLCSCFLLLSAQSTAADLAKGPASRRDGSTWRTSLAVARPPSHDLRVANTASAHRKLLSNQSRSSSTQGKSGAGPGQHGSQRA